MVNYMKNNYKKIYLIIIISLILTLLSCEKDKNGEESLFVNILEGNEISDIVYFKGFLYAGGMEGVYKINLENYEFESVDVGDVFLVKDLVVDNEYLYIGHDSGITVYDGETYDIILDNKSEVADIRVNSLMIDSQKNLWAGTYFGALKYNNNEWETISVDDGLMDDTVFLILEDSYGGIIFGHYASVDSGVSYLRNGEWSYFTIDNGLPHNYITTGINVDDKIYITTGFYDLGGIAVFDISSEGITIVSNIIREWGKHGSKPRSINIDNDLLWIGTEYNGICIMKDENFLKIDIDDGLVSNEVKAIYFDDNDMVWLGTKSGISIVRKSDIYKKIKF